MCPRALLTLSLLSIILLSTAKTAPATAPNYIMDLFRCVREKTPLDCYGVEADSVKSIGGKVVPATKSINRLQNSSVLINFNLTAAIAESNRDDAILAAKLRVYKNQLTEERILALRASGCDTSAITLQLFAVNGNGWAGAESLANVTLTRDDLRVGKWVTFGNLAGTYRQWVNNATSSIQSLAVTAVGTCSAMALGFDADSLNTPLLVAFMRSSDQNMEFLTKGLGEATVRRVQTRGVANNSNPCLLHTYQVVTSNAWSNYIEPDTFQANFCAGLCDAPMDSTNSLYTTQHAQLQYYLNKQYPSQVPAPCCVPKNFGSISFVVVDVRGNPGIKTINNISANSCQCR